MALACLQEKLMLQFMLIPSVLKQFPASLAMSTIVATRLYFINLAWYVLVKNIQSNICWSDANFFQSIVAFIKSELFQIEVVLMLVTGFIVELDLNNPPLWYQWVATIVNQGAFVLQRHHGKALPHLLQAKHSPTLL